MNVRLAGLLFFSCAVFSGAWALDLNDLMNPDDVMLRRPAKRPAVAVVTKTNMVTQTDYVTKTNVVTQTDYVTKTNVVTQTDYVVKTNVVTQTDYVTKTNVIVKSTLDDSARKELEAKLAAALAAQKAAEAQAAETARKAVAERQARESAEATARAAEARAETERKTAEKATADKAAADKRIAYLMNPDPDERPAAKTTTEEKPAETPAAQPIVEVKKRAAAPAPKKALTGRDAVITADRTDYDRKEGVILFDRNVSVDDEQYKMHADRLFVFLEGTNALKRLVAIGHVSITNEEKSAYCARATYQKQTGRIVMYSNDEIKAHLEDGAQGGSSVTGERITFWLNSEQVEVERPVISVPGAAAKGGDLKKVLGKGK